MALLDGILGGAQSVMAFGQQQFENKLAKAKFDEQKRQYDQSFNEGVRQFNAGEVYKQYDLKKLKDQDAKDATRAANNDLFKTYANADYLSPDMQSLNYNRINDDIAAGRNSDRFATAEQLVLGMATQFGDLPEGSEATSVEALPGGGYAITVTNADGSKGAVTTDGSSEPTSEVVRFAPGQLGKLANLQYRTKIAINTDEFNPVSMAASKNLIAADQKGQQERAAFVEQQTQINNLLTQVKATGNVELHRAVQSAIADGGDETAALIAKDFGLPSPQAPTAPAPTSADATPTQAPATPTQAPAQTDTQAPATPTQATTAPAPWSMDSVDRNTPSGRLIASLEGVAKDRAANPRSRKAITPAGQTEKLMARKAKLENIISAAEKNRARNPDIQINPETDGVPKKKAELAQINAYLDKDKPAVFTQAAETDAVAEQAAGKTTAEIAQGIDDGSITVDQQAINLVSQTLKGKGFKNINDLMQLNTRERAIARAAILATSKDPAIRDEMIRQMTNIFDNPDNSPNLNAKDMLTLQNSAADRAYRYKSLRNDMAKTMRSWNDAANTQAADVLAGAQDVFFGPNRDEVNLNYRSAAQFLRGKPFNKFNIWLKQSDRTDEEIANAMPGMTGTLSLTLAAMAGEESGGRGIGGRIRESVIDLISRRGVEDAVDPADFDASRLRVDDPGVDKDGKPKATMIYYTDADGNILNEDGGLQALKDLHPDMYANALSIGIYNTRKANGG